MQFAAAVADPDFESDEPPESSADDSTDLSAFATAVVGSESGSVDGSDADAELRTHPSSLCYADLDPNTVAVAYPVIASEPVSVASAVAQSDLRSDSTADNLPEPIPVTIPV